MGEPDFLPSGRASTAVARLVTADDRLIRELPNVWFAESATGAAVAIPALSGRGAAKQALGPLVLSRARLTVALPRGELILRWQAVERVEDRTDLPGAGGKDAFVFRLSELQRRRLCSNDVLRAG